MDYKKSKMNIKYLTEYLMSYVTAMDKGDTLEMDRLIKEIEIIFHQLCSETNDDDKKKEIINLILLAIKEKTLTHLDVATYTRELVIYGFQ